MTRSDSRWAVLRFELRELWETAVDYGAVLRFEVRHGWRVAFTRTVRK